MQRDSIYPDASLNIKKAKPQSEIAENLIKNKQDTLKRKKSKKSKQQNEVAENEPIKECFMDIKMEKWALPL